MSSRRHPSPSNMLPTTGKGVRRRKRKLMESVLARPHSLIFSIISRTRRRSSAIPLAALSVMQIYIKALRKSEAVAYFGTSFHRLSSSILRLMRSTGGCTEVRVQEVYTEGRITHDPIAAVDVRVTRAESIRNTESGWHSLTGRQTSASRASNEGGVHVGQRPFKIRWMFGIRDSHVKWQLAFDQFTDSLSGAGDAIGACNGVLGKESAELERK
ncbi:uncharacterized protein LAESUDRAFT_752579 [Laetiporus sulphureus 93-53]|uniref:Uncharacterized protein n=1 Tax=Laetiporus sulphureus 93-53 TaxID=1314785 RepID=A0A165BRD8_9APHY|nr:uncharacterized protein LAESUDRAFT_752579 [Laetiporus sulphureus 93-53]KZT01513.1 hypothetical protein LAESUDRAFT_752579 [Laetiporus sulphureus 93-53]